ncbi:hypothetical protein Hgul01_02543 [Herpetosiphon gulosus]|uniref:Uncharacterized protein n=1 Tax=Herpetosiphon gulosus TaxID=1973496 RepID=A0ABP9X1P1_9CHLR
MNDPSPPSPLSHPAGEGEPHHHEWGGTPLSRRSGRGVGGEGSLKPTFESDSLGVRAMMAQIR